MSPVIVFTQDDVIRLENYRQRSPINFDYVQSLAYKKIDRLIVYFNISQDAMHIYVDCSMQLDFELSDSFIEKVAVALNCAYVRVDYPAIANELEDIKVLGAVCNMTGLNFKYIVIEPKSDEVLESIVILYDRSNKKVYDLVNKLIGVSVSDYVSATKDEFRILDDFM